jgi:hypothetical protein
MSNLDLPTDADYYRHHEAAAPFSGHAEFLKHPEYGWLPIIAQTTNIEADIVVVALGRLSDEQPLEDFPILYETWYSEYEDLIFEAEAVPEIVASTEDYEVSPIDPADELVTMFPMIPEKFY